jgi:Tfp pilus assembly protein PilF
MEKDDKAAAAHYQTAIEQVPSSARAHNQLACLYARYERGVARGLAMAKKARALAPEDARIADTLGWLLHLNGEHAEAVPVLYEASCRLPRSPAVWYHLGKALVGDGKKSEAARSFQTALFLDRHFENAGEIHEFLAAYRRELAQRPSVSKGKP